MPKFNSKIILIIIIATLFTSIFTACGSDSSQNTAAQDTQVASETTVPADTTPADTTPAETSTSATSQETAQIFPLTVTDALGTEMTIEKAPAAIVSLTLGTDEMLVGNSEIPGLVDKSRILSLTPYADDTGISNIAGDLDSIPNRFKSEAEKIITVKPDLVLIDTWADSAFVKQLRDSGITVYVFKTPSSVQEQLNTVVEIAHVVGEDKEGVRMVEWMNGKLKAVSDKLKQLDESKRLTIMEYSEMFMSAGLGTNFDSVVTLAGLTNVVSKAGMEGWPEISKEKLLEMNPDILILPSWYYDKNNSLEGMKAGLKADASLAGMKAIAGDRLITVPNQHISAISQYVVLGVEDVAKAAYPELFK